MESQPTVPLEIRVVDLYKCFGTNHVLRGVNLSIERGEMIAVVGGSGSGKTVLLNHMIGQLHPDQGQVWLADHESPNAPLVDLATLDQAGLDRLRIHWAVVFQSNALFSGTVEENIALALQYVQGLDETETAARVRRAVESVGLNPDDVLPIERDQLSGGMAKRVAIARALALNPLLVFFDEPTTGLDPDHAKLIQDLIFSTYQEDQAQLHRTSLIVTHDKDLLYRLRPRVVMLHDGQVFFDGSYTDFEKSTSPIIRPYFELMPLLHRMQKPTT